MAEPGFRSQKLLHDLRSALQCEFVNVWSRPQLGPPTPKDLNERLTCSCEQLKMPNRPLLVGILPLTRGELRLEKSA
jgi:hypothetical protein